MSENDAAVRVQQSVEKAAPDFDCDRPECGTYDDRCASMVAATMGHGACPHGRSLPPGQESPDA